MQNSVVAEQHDELCTARARLEAEADRARALQQQLAEEQASHEQVLKNERADTQSREAAREKEAAREASFVSLSLSLLEQTASQLGRVLDKILERREKRGGGGEAEGGEGAGV